MSELLALDAVTAGYAADIDILRGVTISAESSAITGLIGLNGAGKSTLMKTVCGFLRPKTGRILYDGNDITGIAPHRVIDQGIWYISQESSWIGQFAARGIAILMVDHNVRRVVKMASRIYVLNLGEITAAGDAADFAGDLHEQVKAWLGINF
jgi:ABC-type branched-subunit amino acid transport system ATPase component